MLKDKLKGVPAKSGVYLFHDESGEIIYVGKARELNKRLRQYFQDPEKLPYRTKFMVSRIHNFEYIITDNELEALILENNQIKKYKPRYNVLLKDDKNFPYLKLTIKEDFPRLTSTRKLTKDGSIYFGPYSPAGELYKLASTIRIYFGLRQCKISKFKKKDRPCINYQMGLCSSPCTEKITKKEYDGIVDDIKKILRGQVDELVSELNNRMIEASINLEFEKAARIRDQINAIKRVVSEKQKIVTTSFADRDFIALLYVFKYFLLEAEL